MVDRAYWSCLCQFCEWKRREAEAAEPAPREAVEADDFDPVRFRDDP